MEHLPITTAFEFEPSAPPDSEGYLASACYEVVVAHINVIEFYRETGCPDPELPCLPQVEKGWSSRGESALGGFGGRYAPGEWINLSMQIGTAGNLAKVCVCLDGLDQTAIAAAISYAFPSELNPVPTWAFGPRNLHQGKWVSRNTLISVLNSAGQRAAARDIDEGEELDQFIYFNYTKACGSPCHVPKCKCIAKMAVSIFLTDKSTEYTASDGTKITLTDPGDYKKSVEEAWKAELAIKLDCAKGDDPLTIAAAAAAAGGD